MAKTIIPDKICSHCGGNEWYISYYKKENRIMYLCVIRNKERKKNPDYTREYEKRRRLNPEYREKKRLANKKWREKMWRLPEWREKKRLECKKDYYKEGNKEKNQLRNKIASDTLTDAFVRSRIHEELKKTKVPFDKNLITPELIKQYRKITLIKRESRCQKQNSLKA